MHSCQELEVIQHFQSYKYFNLFQQRTEAFPSIFLSFNIHTMLIYECIIFNMNMKYREAAVNLSKQAHLLKNNIPDPLASICAQKALALKKTKLIYKPGNYAFVIAKQAQKNKTKQNQVKGQLAHGSKSSLTRKQKKKKLKQSITVDDNYNQQWFRYLPQACDQFQVLENRKFQQNIIQDVKIQANQQTDTHQNSMQSNAQYPKFDMHAFNINQFKSKLGIGIAKIQETPKQQQAKKIEPVKHENQPGSLPFAGRPFEQAPPRPPPKKIYQYPPTCKVAGLYQWPQPRSQYRQWKSQMKQSRKLK